MKTKILLLLLLFSTLSYAQSFEWETAVVQGNSVQPNSIAFETVNNVQAVYRAENNTPVMLQSGGIQGTSGTSVINQQLESNVYISFDPGINIQSIEVYDVTTNGGWEIIPEMVGSGSTVTVSQALNAQTVTLNWTNVTLLKIQPIGTGLQDNFGVDEIVFTPCIVNIPDVNWKQELLANQSININNDTEIQCSEASGFSGIMNVFGFGSGVADLTGIEAFTQVTEINAGGAGLTSINLSGNPLIQVLDLQQNNLTNIDLSTNHNLSFVNLRNNDLTELNIANGTNTNLTSFNAQSNPNLMCIQIDAGFTPPTNGLWGKDATASYSDNCNTNCIITIPDANFKAALVADTAINTDGDTEISCAEATAFTGTINVSNQNIADLTGIEAFINITQLNCQNNNLTSIDISTLTQLVALDVSSNMLSTIDITANINIFNLICSNNLISSLDVSTLVSLNFLQCRNNQLSTIDISNNFLLKSLDVSFNNLSSLDVSNNPNIELISAFLNNLSTIISSNNFNLQSLFLDGNNLTSLDITMFPLLRVLAIAQNQIQTLDFNNNPLLSEFTAEGAQLTSLDLSNNPALFLLDIRNNDLQSFNVSNGNNTGIMSLLATGNSNLSCIQIDANFTPPSSWNKDATASYNTNCATAGIEDSQLTQIDIYPNPASDVLNINSNLTIKKTEFYNLQGQLILTSSDNTSIDINELTSGMFIVKITTKDGSSISRQLIKK